MTFFNHAQPFIAITYF